MIRIVFIDEKENEYIVQMCEQAYCSSFSEDFSTVESASRFGPVIQLPKGSIEKIIGKKLVKPSVSTLGNHYMLSKFAYLLWHNSSEEPKDDVDILVLRPSGCILIHHSSTVNWQLYTTHNNIKQWCYINDILPKEGEE